MGAPHIRKTNLRQLIVEADPEWPRDSRLVPEYEFSNGRTFKGDYTKRGAYKESES